MISNQISFVATESIKIVDIAPDPVKAVENWDDPEDEEDTPAKGQKRKAPASKKGKEKESQKGVLAKKRPFLLSSFSKKAPSAKVIFDIFFFLFFFFF